MKIFKWQRNFYLNNQRLFTINNKYDKIRLINKYFSNSNKDLNNFNTMFKKPLESKNDDIMLLLKKNNIEEFHPNPHNPINTVSGNNFKINHKVFLTETQSYVYYLYLNESENDNMDLKMIEKLINGKKLISIDNASLSNHLPLALLNLPENDAKKLIFIIDKELKNEYVSINPESDSKTACIKIIDLIRLIKNHGILVRVFDKLKSLNEAQKNSKVDSKKTESNFKDNEIEKHKLSLQNPKSQEYFTGWYQEIIKKSELIDYYDISGCYILRPYAYEIWEGIQLFLNNKFKELGVKNCYFPMFVSQESLEKEKKHIEGFSPEVAWVTQYGDSKLDKKIAIRPTSETIIYPQISKWISSHRDIPLLLNQWCNVVRWEFKNPTPFIRTREFLWQEGHSVHESEEESEKFMLRILEIYREAYEDILAVPVIKGYKSENEKFAGALRTSTLETLIPDNGKAVQCATSHNLGQNFSKMFDIKFLDKNQNFQYCWQESWGFTTRSIGVLIMIHGDDIGLILPPKIAPIQIVLIPIIGSNDKTGEIIKKSNDIYESLKKIGVRIKHDDNPLHNPGFKYNYWELKGVPLRIEFGKRDLEKNQVTFAFRDTKEKICVPYDNINESAIKYLDEIQQRLFESAKKKLENKTKLANDFDNFNILLNESNIILTPWCCNSSCEDDVKAKIKSLNEKDDESVGSCKTLCIPLQQVEINKTKCFNCSEEARKLVYWGRSY